MASSTPPESAGSWGSAPGIRRCGRPATPVPSESTGSHRCARTPSRRLGPRIPASPSLLRLAIMVSEFLDRGVGVDQPGEVHVPSAADQRLDGVSGVPDIDVHAGDHMLMAHPEGDELARRRITPNHHAVARGGQPRVLHADVVLVGEEGGEPLVAGGEVFFFKQKTAYEILAGLEVRRVLFR